MFALDPLRLTAPNNSRKKYSVKHDLYIINDLKTEQKNMRCKKENECLAPHTYIHMNSVQSSPVQYSTAASPPYPLLVPHRRNDRREFPRVRNSTATAATPPPSNAPRTW